MISLLKKNYGHLKAYNDEYFENCHIQYMRMCSHRELFGVGIVDIYGKGKFAVYDIRVAQNGLPEMLCRTLDMSNKRELWFPVIDLINARMPNRKLGCKLDYDNWLAHIYLYMDGTEPSLQMTIDCTMVGKDKWKEVFKQVCDLCKKNVSGRGLIKRIREFRYQYNLKINSQVNKSDYEIPVEVVYWLFSYIEKIADDSCIDNHRCALVGNRKQERRYRQQRESGCCGFVDRKVICPIDNKEYWVGCNYGH
jgi:hypothetical protein